MLQSRPGKICITMGDKWARKASDPPLRRWPQGKDSSTSTPTTKNNISMTHQRPHSAGPTFGRSRRRIIESQAREFWAQQQPSPKPLTVSQGEEGERGDASHV